MKRLLQICLFSISLALTSPVLAVLSITNLSATNSGTDSTSFDSASLTPTSGKLYLIAVHNVKGSTPDQPTVYGTNGWSGTWTLIGSRLYNSSSTPLNRISIFWAVAVSSVAGVITADAGVGNTQLGWAISVEEVTNANTTTPIVASNVKNAFIDNTSNLITISMNAVADAKNAVYAAFGRNTNAGLTQGTGWTELSDAGHAGPGTRLETQYLVNPGSNPSADKGAGTEWMGGVASEINEVSVGGTPTHRFLLIGALYPPISLFPVM